MHLVTFDLILALRKKNTVELDKKTFDLSFELEQQRLVNQEIIIFISFLSCANIKMSNTVLTLYRNSCEIDRYYANFNDELLTFRNLFDL